MSFFTVVLAGNIFCTPDIPESLSVISYTDLNDIYLEQKAQNIRVI